MSREQNHREWQAQANREAVDRGESTKLTGQDARAMHAAQNLRRDQGTRAPYSKN